MDKLLLTGGLGYIGSKFFEKYSQNYEITILDTNFFSNQNFVRNNIINKDIRDISKEDVLGFDFVVHMGELSNDPLGKLNPKITNEINHTGTKQLLNLCNRSNVKKFIYMSSASVYGFSDKESSEDSPVNPLTEYARAKVQNENYIKTNDFSFETIILRNSTAFGYSNNLRLDLVINDLVFTGMRDRRLKIISDGTPKRPFVHIDDICRVINSFLKKEDTNDKEIFNVGSKELNLSIKEVSEKIATHLGIDNLTFGAKDPDQRSYYLNFNKLNKSFEKFKYDLDKGIKNLIDNYENHVFTGNEIRISKINKLLKENKVSDYLYWDETNKTF